MLVVGRKRGPVPRGERERLNRSQQDAPLQTSSSSSIIGERRPRDTRAAPKNSEDEQGENIVQRNEGRESNRAHERRKA